MGDLQGPEKSNCTCGKIVHRGMMDRGFTVCQKVGALHWYYDKAWPVDNILLLKYITS
jgi:hypothetical protein